MDEPILRYFAFEHLPPSLQEVSRPFSELANDTIMHLPRSPERTVALRKLLESKDAAVRAALPQEGYPLAPDGIVRPPATLPVATVGERFEGRSQEL